MKATRVELQVYVTPPPGFKNGFVAAGKTWIAGRGIDLDYNPDNGTCLVTVTSEGQHQGKRLIIPASSLRLVHLEPAENPDAPKVVEMPKKTAGPGKVAQKAAKAIKKELDESSKKAIAKA